MIAFLPPTLALLLSPLILGAINQTKAFFAGRKGQPVLQVYFDFWKLLHKGAVYSSSTTWLFRAGPIVGLAAVMTCLVLTPLGGVRALMAFPGDLVLVVCLLGLMRFLTVTAALETGSAFEGMGASREVHLSALAEPALLLAMATVARSRGSFSLSEMFSTGFSSNWLQHGPAVVLAVTALFLVLLAENARIPVDDPNTHLELTMIHEVMVLDHGGPDLAFILYGVALKFWLFGALLIGALFPPDSVSVWANLLLAIGAQFALAIIVGTIESTMARLRLLVVPQLLVGAAALAVVAFILVLN